MTNDPRRVHGEGIVGPDGLDDHNAILVDAANAVLMDRIGVAMMQPRRLTDTGVEAGDPVAALTLGGRINRTTERVEIVFTFEPIDGAAAIIAELFGLAHRWGGEEFVERLSERVAAVMAAGHA